VRRKATTMSGSHLVIIVITMITAIGASVALYSSHALQINSTSSASTTTSSSVTPSFSSSSYTLSGTGPSGIASTTTSNSTSAVLVLIPYGIYANQQLNFEPANIRVVIGINNTVRWVNKDYTLHTISALSTPNNSPSFDSAPIFQGGSFEYTFTVPGQYAYYCPWHPGWMRGTITVIARNGKA
jgi:plastocyanin